MNAVATFVVDLFPSRVKEKARTSGPHIALVDAFGVTFARSDPLPGALLEWLQKPSVAEHAVTVRFKAARTVHMARADIRGIRVDGRLSQAKHVEQRILRGDTLVFTWQWKGHAEGTLL